MPGDKSISHRALILNSIAQGEAKVTGLSGGADVLSTKSCLKALGARIEDLILLQKRKLKAMLEKKQKLKVIKLKSHLMRSNKK